MATTNSTHQPIAAEYIRRLLLAELGEINLPLPHKFMVIMGAINKDRVRVGNKGKAPQEMVARTKQVACVRAVSSDAICYSKSSVLQQVCKSMAIQLREYNKTLQPWWARNVYLPDTTTIYISTDSMMGVTRFAFKMDMLVMPRRWRKKLAKGA